MTRHVALYDEWMLADSYVEVASSKGDSPRPEFRRLCQKASLYVVQAEKEKRSSVIETENGKQRKSTKYSSKRK